MDRKAMFNGVRIAYWHLLIRRNHAVWAFQDLIRLVHPAIDTLDGQYWNAFWKLRGMI